jgi:hypothetical protein
MARDRILKSRHDKATTCPFRGGALDDLLMVVLVHANELRPRESCPAQARAVTSGPLFSRCSGELYWGRQLRNPPAALRQSEGKLSTWRGFTSRRAAATRRRLADSIERGEVEVARETFEAPLTDDAERDVLTTAQKI